MMNYFVFNDENSLEDYELYFETLPVLPLASVSETNNPQITCVLGFETNKKKLLKIRRWLSINEGQLKFSFDDRTFNVSNIIATEYSKNKTFTIINIIFEVDKYCPIKMMPIVFDDNFDNLMIFNEGNYSSLPLITIEGSGNIDITINEVIYCTIENVNSVVTLDSEIQECYEGYSGQAISLKNRDMYGEFPVLDNGPNRISISSTINSLTKVTIVPRWVL